MSDGNPRPVWFCTVSLHINMCHFFVIPGAILLFSFLPLYSAVDLFYFMLPTYFNLFKTVLLCGVVLFIL